MVLITFSWTLKLENAAQEHNMEELSNIDRLVTKASSNEAPGCTYEHGCVSMLAPKSGWLLSMVLIKFWT
jgi:hypothetical protein